jgi:hypothetical protein
MRLRLSQGRLEVDVARSIEITGQGGGDIVFEQADGGIAIKPDGSVRLFGNEVTLAATNGNVQFNGPVNYRVPEGNQATPASEVTPEAAQTPDDLPDPDARSLVEVGAHKPLLALTDPDGEPLERLSAWFSTRGYDREQGPVTLTLRRETSATSAELGTGTRSPDEPDGAWDGELAPVGQPQPGASMRPADEDKPDRFILQARLQSETREESS